MLLQRATWVDKDQDLFLLEAVFHPNLTIAYIVGEVVSSGRENGKILKVANMGILERVRLGRMITNGLFWELALKF